MEVPALLQKNICENYSKSEQEAVNIVTYNSVTLAFLRAGRSMCGQ